MLGIFSVQEAQKLADSKNLDLVKIVPNSKPPVCKITDYSKSLFEKTKMILEINIIFIDGLSNTKFTENLEGDVLLNGWQSKVV